MADTTTPAAAPAKTPTLAPGLSANLPPAPRPQIARKPRNPVSPDKSGYWWGTGRRKSAVARVRMRLAKDAAAPKYLIQVTGKKFKTVDEYFCEMRDRMDCNAPLKVTNTAGKFDVIVRLHGGGFMGQAGAVLLGLSRALRDYDPTLEGALRDAGFLTRDAREVERKKYGQAGARRRFQFSKR